MGAAASKTEEVTLRLTDQVSGAANAMSGSLSRLENQIVREQAALGRMEAALGAAKSKLAGIANSDSGVVDIAKYKAQESAVSRLMDSIGSKRDRIADLNEKIREGGNAAKESEPPFRAIGKSMRLFGGASGEVESKMTEVIHLFRKLGPEIAVIVAGILVLGGAVGILVATFTKAITTANEYREKLQRLSTAGVTLWNGQRASIDAATKLNETIENVADSSALGADKIEEYAIKLRQAHGIMGESIFTGKRLETTLATMAEVGAGGNEQLAESYYQAAVAARFFGGDLDKLNARMDAKFGKAAREKLLNIEVQLAHLHKNIGYIFSGADIRPLLVALQGILSIFNKNEVAAKYLKDSVTRFTEAAIGGILDLTIWLLKSYIWIRQHDKIWQVLVLTVKGFGLGLAVIAGVALLAFALIGVAVAAVVVAFGAFGYACAWVGEQAGKLSVFLGQLWDDMVNAGVNMILGVVEGIKSAGGRVLEALVGVVKGAVRGVKSFLKIESPSKLMRDDVGYNMGAGTAEGLDKSAPMVADAAVDMASGGAKAAKGATAANDNGRAIVFTGCTFGGDLTESTLRGWILKILDGEQMDGTPAT